MGPSIGDLVNWTLPGRRPPARQDHDRARRQHNLATENQHLVPIVRRWHQLHDRHSMRNTPGDRLLVYSVLPSISAIHRACDHRTGCPTVCRAGRWSPPGRFVPGSTRTSKTITHPQDGPSAGSSLNGLNGNVDGVHDGSGLIHGENQSCVVLVKELNHDCFTWSAHVPERLEAAPVSRPQLARLGQHRTFKRPRPSGRRLFLKAPRHRLIFARRFHSLQLGEGRDEPWSFWCTPSGRRVIATRGRISRHGELPQPVIHEVTD